MKIKFPNEIGFIAPTPNNTFWITTSYGQELYELDLSGKLTLRANAPSQIYLSFAVKHPRLFAPIGIKEDRRESKISSFDTELFDPDREDLIETIDYSSGDELWDGTSPDEDHEEDAEWAIAWKMNYDNSPCLDSSCVLRAACCYPFLVWRRNLKVSEQCIDPFSAIAPLGVIKTLSQSKGIVFSNLSTDKSIIIEEVERCQQTCLSCRNDYALVGVDKTLHLLKNPFFE